MLHCDVIKQWLPHMWAAMIMAAIKLAGGKQQGYSVPLLWIYPLLLPHSLPGNRVSVKQDIVHSFFVHPSQDLLN